MNTIIGWRNGLSYGLMGTPLAFVALPIYVLVPDYYAQKFGIPLAVLGAVLLGLRLLDAIVDPLWGLWIDRWLYSRTKLNSLYFSSAISIAIILMMLGFSALWFPLAPFNGTQAGIILWLSLALVITFAGFSVLTISHNSWAARSIGSEVWRSQWVSWREGCGLVGVVLASVLPQLWGFSNTSIILFFLLILAGALWINLPIPLQSTAIEDPASQPLAMSWAVIFFPLGVRKFRNLLLVFTLNGFASAIPATLLTFFVRDRLDMMPWLGGFLVLYFLAAGFSLPLWNLMLAHLSLIRIWMLGMVIAILSFVGVIFLKTGDGIAFALICLVTGFALGADLCAPSALLSGIIQQRGESDLTTAHYFGWWAFAQKLALALSAGIVLPLLQVLGYQLGANDAHALLMLTLAYGLLPCVIKGFALIFLMKMKFNEDKYDESNR